MALSKRLRFEILRRDNHTCRYCGGVAPDVRLTVDHVLAVALGGGDDPGNLVAACHDCNAGKSSTSADEITVQQVSDDAIRWARAVAAAAELALNQRGTQQAYLDEFDANWHAWDFGPKRKYTHDRPSDWPDSIEHFRRRGMPIEILVESADIALRNTRIYEGQLWRYFMGVCWKKLTELESCAVSLFGNDGRET